MSRRPRSAAATTIAAAAVLVAGLFTSSSADAAAGDRVDLRVLVVTNGNPNVEAIRSQLAIEGVPTTTVDLGDTARPLITASFLSDIVASGPRAKYQSVVLPDAAPGSLSAAEMTALSDYEVRFGIRQVDAYTYPSAQVGLNAPSYYGSLDGRAATVTPSGLASFPYLKGSFSVDDYAPAVSETYGYLSTPMLPSTSSSFTPLVTIDDKPVVGSYVDAGREQLVITGAFNANQTWFRLMAHGLITWMTRGVHLGHNRNYFAVQVDDVLLPDSRWSIDGRCTPGADCPTGVSRTLDIRMVPSDVSALLAWQNTRNFRVDLAFNAAGSVDAIAAGSSDPLTTALLASKSGLRWLNHTYSHRFLGCVQDFSVIPWRCQTDAANKIVYLSQADIATEISQNLAWANQNGVSVTASDLVTGEHSGLAVLPQQPEDNPNLAAALQSTGITSLASDASREPRQRSVGPSQTVPRHPMNVFYNVATPAEEVDEYNWIYTSRAAGGSGLCDTNANSTCIAPLSLSTGYTDYIVPLESRIALGHVLANDPRPHYLHQSNFAEGRIAYPVLDGVLSTYGALFANNAPLTNLRLGQQGTVLSRAAAWQAASATGVISAYTLGGRLYVTSTVNAKNLVPVTVPQNVAFGLAYAGERSDYGGVKLRSDLVLTLN